MKVLLSICLLLALFSPGASLICYSCTAPNKDCGTANITECTSDQDMCTSVTTQDFLVDGELPYKLSYKGCTTSQDCKKGSYFADTVDGKYIRVGIDCCQTDKCNEKPYNVSDPESLNGLECLGCLSKTSYKCTPNSKVPCRGNETECIKLSGDTAAAGRVEKLALHGCVTPSFCEYPLGKTELAGGLIMLDFMERKCFHAHPIRHTPKPTPIQA